MRRKFFTSILYSLLAMVACIGLAGLLWAAVPTGSPVLYSAPDIATIPTLILNNFLRLGQQSSDPATPAANTWNLYTKSGGLFLQNSSGTVYTLSVGGGYSTVQDESLPLTQQTVLNFVGAGVTVTNNTGAGSTDISIPGGGGSANEWAPVAAATTANINLSSPGSTHDGVSLAVTTPRQRLLVWQQSTATGNGLYTYEGATSALIRATDADAGSEFVNNMGVYVQSGTLYGGSVFRLQNTGTVTLGSTNINFTREPSKGLYLDQVNANSGVMGLTSAGKAPWNRKDEYVAHADLSASSQIDAATLQKSIIGIQNSGAGKLTLTTGNPRMTGCTSGNDGVRQMLVGLSATKTVEIPNGQGVLLPGNTGSVTVGLAPGGTSAEWRCNGSTTTWELISAVSLQTAANVGRSIVATETTPVRIANAAGTSYYDFYVDSSTSNPSQVATCNGSACPHTTTNNILLSTSGSKPTCTSAERFAIWPTAGGAGVADVVEVCSKNAADAYAWGALGSGGSGTRTTTVPLKLSSINVTDSNAFVDTLDRTNYDTSAIRYVDGVTGCAHFTHVIPANLAATPAWNLVAVHSAVTGAGGNAILTASAKVFATNVAKDAALTSLSLVGSGAVAVSTSANTTITTLSATSFDSEVALVAGRWMVLTLCRTGGSGSDTLSSDWLLEALSIRYDVN